VPDNHDGAVTAGWVDDQARVSREFALLVIAAAAGAVAVLLLEIVAGVILGRR
jgi:hypothetical protein